MVGQLDLPLLVNPPVAVYGLALAVLGYLALGRFLNVPYSGAEPPVVTSRVPFLGHIIGMIRDGSAYYGTLKKKYNLPIYTLLVPRGKIYVVHSPSLIAAIDRRSKTISFAPYVVQFAKRILIPSKNAIDELQTCLRSGNLSQGLLPETLEAMHHSLAPGDDLDAISAVMLESLSSLVESLDAMDNVKGFGLFDWTKQVVTCASTNAIYGTESNPFQDPSVYDAFWAVCADFALLGLNVLPGLTAPRGNRQRRAIFEAMSRYYAKGSLKTASPLVKARYKVNSKYGVSQPDIERFDLSVIFGLLVNTAPGAGWALWYLYSDSTLLDEIRHEVDLVVNIPARQDAAACGGEHIVDIQAVTAACPLLISFLQEVLRVLSTNASGRVVLQDTWIDDKYLLKKDAMLLIPSAELHTNESVWGPTASSFDPARFLKADGVRKVPAAAQRSFGSGASVCPGRNFAMNELTALLVIMVLKYDIAPVSGVWKMPKKQTHIFASICTPVEDVQVRVTERPEVRDLRFKLIKKPEGRTSDKDGN